MFSVSWWEALLTVVTQTQDDRGCEASLAFPTPEAEREGSGGFPWTQVLLPGGETHLAFPPWSPSDDHCPFIMKTVTSVTGKSLGHCGPFCNGHTHLTSY